MERYAKVIVSVGLNIQPGQELMINAPIETSDLVELVTNEAYKAGAKLVTTFYSNEKEVLSRFKYAQDDSFDYASSWLDKGQTECFKNGGARLVILGRDPELLKGQDPKIIGRIAKASSASRREMMKLITNSHSQWSIASYATVAWAKSVFPTLTKDDAVDRLWSLIFSAVRVTEPDFMEKWEKHNAFLHTVSNILNDKNYDALKFIGDEPGEHTDITIGLAKNHVWCGGSKEGMNGIDFNANIPTEEVFTTPHRVNVNGIVKATKPLLFRGQIIKDIVAVFENGKIVDFKCSEGEEAFRILIESDEGAARIGEVALVPNSSPISKTGVLFNETLFDENASCHIAQGQSYSTCMIEGASEEELFEYGANKSSVHVDWMIGGPHISVIGIKNGIEEYVMVNGEFVYDSTGF